MPASVTLTLIMIKHSGRFPAVQSFPPHTVLTSSPGPSLQLAGDVDRELLCLPPTVLQRRAGSVWGANKTALRTGRNSFDFA